MAKTHAHKLPGFTLLEVGVVLIILSLMMSGLLTIVNQNIRITKQRELDSKLNAIESAVLAYRKEHGFIPCPGDLSLALTNANFGVQGATAGTCTGGTPAANFSSSNTVGGGVPVRALNLTDDYAFDPWGDRLLYVIDKRATSSTTFDTDITSNSSLGSLTVKDKGDVSITTTAVLVLLSFGPNGHGAYQISGQRKYVASVNAHEWDNCGCNATTAQTFDATFYIHPGTTSTSGVLDNFDDVGRFYSRQQLASPTTDLLTETP